jgi:hypothetical protein
MLSTDPALESSHNEAVAGGQSAVVDTTWGHFVCFVNLGGKLYELDGRRPAPLRPWRIAPSMTREVLF